MKIDSSAISFSSSHTLVKKYEKTEELRMWIGEQDPNQPRNSQQTSDRVTLTEEAKNNLLKNHGTDEVRKKADELSGEDGKLMLIKMLVEALTGKKINIKNILNADEEAERTAEDGEVAEAEGQQPARQGWGIVYNSSESYYEHEQMSVAAEGIIRTADGMEIQFALELSMDWQYSHNETFSLRAGDAALVDPLVINYAGPAAELTTSKFSFDLDADGEAEDISFVGSGSGLLTLDLNNDGIVNDGKELFGPQTGDGFSELASYDQDGNNWIDESDTIFEQLRLWIKDSEGNDSLVSLKDQGIGAIYLGNIASEFSLKDSSNDLLGRIDRTGIYLNEAGTVGTVQQIDLVA